MYCEKFIKLLRSPFPVILHIFFTKRAIKGHLDIQSALQGHSKGTARALQRYLGTQDIRRAFGHSRHLDTWALSHLKGTWPLRHLGTCAFEALKALYLADSDRSGQIFGIMIFEIIKLK